MSGGEMSSSYELEGLNLALDFLRVEGHEPQDIYYPDIENRQTPAVDLEFRRENEWWSLEHARLTYPDDGPGYRNAVIEGASPELKRLAAEARVALYVSFGPKPGVKTKDAVKITVRELIDAAKNAIRQGHEVRLDDGMTSVQLSENLSIGEVGFASFLAASCDLGKQAKDLMRSVVKPKIERQLAPCRERGHRTALVLDLRADPEKEQVPFFIASIDTFRAALTEVSAEFLFIPDSIFFISQDAVVTRLQ